MPPQLAAFLFLQLGGNAEAFRALCREYIKFDRLVSRFVSGRVVTGWPLPFVRTILCHLRPRYNAVPTLTAKGVSFPPRVTQHDALFFPY